MSEPEEVVLDGAHAATTFVAGLWRRHAVATPELGLGETRRRLELLVLAYGGQALPIVAAEAAARPTLFGRIARRIPKPVSYTHLRAHETPEHLVCRLLLEK